MLERLPQDWKFPRSYKICMLELLPSRHCPRKTGALAQTNSQEAETIAERIREKVESTPFPNRQVTISIGIASCSQIICTPQEIISAADKALYAAKRQGRNNVQVYENLKSVRV